jgi:hypothetical protein
VALDRIDVSEEHIAFIIKMERIRELGTTLAITGNCCNSSLILSTLMMEGILSYERLVVTRATRRHIPEDGILHSNRSENLKSYIALTGWTV